MKNLLLMAALMMSPLAVANDDSCHVQKGACGSVKCSKQMCVSDDCDKVCKKHCKMKDKQFMEEIPVGGGVIPFFKPSICPPDTPNRV